MQSCKYCQDNFDTAKKMKKHISENHREKEIKCEICSKTCKNQALLENHVKSTHSTTQYPRAQSKKLSVTSHILGLWGPIC